jgi:protein tyrosine phosphatase (PTP) superfamily phosphohydrolase (DUF442 family)
MHGSFNRFPRSGVFSVTTKFLCQIVGGALLLVFPQMPPPPKISSAAEQQTQPPNKNLVDSLTREVPAPVILCIDDNPAGGGQPSSEAYAKAAMNGFRSVLTLRSPKDGVDLTRERLVVEQNKLRYFNIPYRADFPQREQVDEFLKLARDPLNQPMLVNCAFAERVAPLMMMFHILEQGWSEDRAVEEAGRSGLATTKLRQFAKNYLANRKKLGSKPSSKS